MRLDIVKKPLSELDLEFLTAWGPSYYAYFSSFFMRPASNAPNDPDRDRERDTKVAMDCLVNGETVAVTQNSETFNVSERVHDSMMRS